MALANLDLVEMWPKDLMFHGRFKKVNKKRIIILNMSPMEIAFKASDTMPDSIRLVPEYGYISPKERAIITVTILPFIENSVPSREDVTICLSPAPENKTNAFWSNENSWPEESRTTNLIVKFVENDEESSSSSESEEEESSSSDNEQLVANSSSSSDQESSESVEGEDDSESESDESESPSKPACAKSSEN